ncbi:hypothetical protein C8R47DRAFT_1113153 [Mycena vitilis]|nr:hypothetical protein C8R47DRAFT_1113153 [Mycena vitilis]
MQLLPSRCMFGTWTCARSRFTTPPRTRLPGIEQRRHFWNMNDPTLVFPNLLAPVRQGLYNKDPGIPLGLPDSKLPEPWTCDWHAWGLLPSWFSCGGGGAGGGIFDPRLSELGIAGPVIPLLFRSTQHSSTSTVFAARVAQRLAFYLFDEPSDSVYRFEQVRPPQNSSAEEFVETVNWNRMTYLGFAGEGEALPKSDIQGYGLLTLRDLDNFSSPWALESRILQDPFAQRKPTVDTVLRPTQCFFIPDTHLPEGWSCEWEHRPPSLFLPIPLVSKLQDSFNLPMPLKPIMYRLGSDATILESDEIFYVYGLDMDSGEFIPALYRFGGRFSSVEDFMEYSNWKQMECLTYNPAPGNKPPHRVELNGPPSVRHCASTKQRKQHNPLLKTGGNFRAAAERP